MKNRTYATEITKDYLTRLGITNVTPDGLHVFKRGKELSQSKSKSGKKNYLVVGLYDPQRRQAVPKEKRTNSTGQFTLSVHVINYVWNIGTRPAGYVVDHIDNNPLNNDISNLQLLTPKSNVRKEKTNWDTAQIKCKLNKPLSFYEDKLNHYLELHDEAQKRGDAEACHKFRSNISQTRARIRYYNAHIDEANAIKAEQEKAEAEKLAKKEAKKVEKEAEQAKKDAYHAKAARLRDLEEITIAARMAYLQAQWDYGKDSFMTQCAKQEWREAVRNRNEFLGIKGKNDGF